MFFIFCTWLWRRIYPAWAVVTFSLALFSPGLLCHISTSSLCINWVEASADTATVDLTILTLNLAIVQALADNPNLAQIKARADAMAAIPAPGRVSLPLHKRLIE